MGYSSYLCKHCNHGIVDASATDEGINEWMAHVVMMTGNGSRLIEPEYGGYEGDYERFSMGSDAVWVHYACWEMAGKPEHDAYDGPSAGDPNQGAGSFRGDHDVIDPRITNEAERERLLAEGIQARELRRYDNRAQKVAEWLDPEEREWHDDDKKAAPWKHRYTYHRALKRGADGKFVRDDDGLVVDDPEAWRVIDELDRELSDDENKFGGTEDDLKAELAARWAAFVESDEAAAYVARRVEIRAEYHREHIEQCKTEGRFKPTYGPRTIDGEEKWPVYYVADELHHKFEKDESKLFYGKGCRTRAEARAEVLNGEWAAAGYPDPRGDA